jgi:hypothetical protein
MTGGEIAMQARNACKSFQAKCGKFAGAVTAELMKKHLGNAGITTSARDVFIQGIPLEIDLIVPYPKEEPTQGLLYEPRQVAVALEIKKSGAFGKQTIEATKNNFKRLRDRNVACAYVTLEERRSFIYRVTKENIGGFPCFTLAWHKVTGGILEDTQEWDGLVTFLRDAQAGNP